MTREQAVKIAQEINHKYRSDITPRSIEMTLDLYEALGLIKFEQPKGPTEQLCEAFGWPLGARSHAELVAALKSAGLKLVPERQP